MLGTAWISKKHCTEAPLSLSQPPKPKRHSAGPPPLSKRLRRCASPYMVDFEPVCRYHLTMSRYSYYRVYDHWTHECIGVLRCRLVKPVTAPLYSRMAIDHVGVHCYLKDINQAEYETDLAFEIKDFGAIDK